MSLTPRGGPREPGSGSFKPRSSRTALSSSDSLSQPISPPISAGFPEELSLDAATLPVRDELPKRRVPSPYLGPKGISASVANLEQISKAGSSPHEKRALSALVTGFSSCRRVTVIQTAQILEDALKEVPEASHTEKREVRQALCDALYDAHAPFAEVFEAHLRRLGMLGAQALPQGSTTDNRSSPRVLFSPAHTLSELERDFRAEVRGIARSSEFGAADASELQRLESSAAAITTCGNLSTRVLFAEALFHRGVEFEWFTATLPQTVFPDSARVRFAEALSNYLTAVVRRTLLEVLGEREHGDLKLHGNELVQCAELMAARKTSKALEAVQRYCDKDDSLTRRIVVLYVRALALISTNSN